MSDALPRTPATPREAFDLLTAGNLRFVTGAPRHPDRDAVRRADAAAARHPYAAVLGGSGSRPAAGIVFDRKPVDRVASGRAAVAGPTYRRAEGSVRTVASRGPDLPPDGAAAPATASTPADR
ncbi:hypothetical protein GCM10010406_39730 [Streptomyces thermolineatus]|uniref:Uncharacterized protein n=1 Tax=Streptomyces thermolineatus TaxID=44033 RepID=A0ABP5ZN26_9ACTN